MDASDAPPGAQRRRGGPCGGLGRKSRNGALTNTAARPREVPAHHHDATDATHHKTKRLNKEVSTASSACRS